MAKTRTAEHADDTLPVRHRFAIDDTTAWARPGSSTKTTTAPTRARRTSCSPSRSRTRASPSTHIRELRIVDLPGRALDVYRRPSAHGYREHQRLVRGKRVALAAFPRVSFRVADVLG